LTLPFPSFWSRNLTSGQYINVASGLIENGSDLALYGRKVREAFDRYLAGVPADYERELLIERVMDPDTLFESVRYDAPEFGRVSPGNPLDVQRTWQESGSRLGTLFLDRVPGLRAVRQGYDTLLGSGAKTSRLVEYMNRVSMYEYLKAKGWTPQAAAAKVQELQVDYSALAPFEKQVMRRLVPFYTFQRKMAPVLLKIIGERPGGAIGQTLRLARDASQHDAFTPDYVTQTLSIPNPFDSGEDGSRSYWAGFGLPFEQHLQYLSGPRDAGREFLSQLNPLVKAPLELITNQSFFQRGPAGAGRPLDDLDPTVGRTISNLGELVGMEPSGPVPMPDLFEFAVGYSPASRFATTARQLSDPRKNWLDKALNFATGVRVTDVSPAVQEAVLRDRAREMMRDMDAKSFEKIYFSPEQEAAMPPDEKERAQRLEQLMTILAQRAKQRKQAVTSAGNRK
jgi:hypothetical protein